MIIENDLINQ